MYDVVIAGGQVVREQGVTALDVAIEGETIVEVAAGIETEARRRIDASGLVILPGLIDPHVHLGIPMKGTASSDDADTGTAAALFGGVTTIFDFTLRTPGQSLADSLRARQAEFSEKANCDYCFHVNATGFSGGFERRIDHDLGELLELGATSLKVFTTYSREGLRILHGDLRVLFERAAAKGITILVHAEEDSLVTNRTERLIGEGRTAATDYPESRPPEAEARAIRNVIAIARDADSAVYFVHVSTAEGAQAIVSERNRSTKPIYFETCPQYLLLDDESYLGVVGAQFIVTPPLRKPADNAALLEMLADGSVDTVATDHCSFKRSQKKMRNAPFSEIPSGLPGVETRLVLLHTLAVSTGKITLERLVDLTSTGPARIFGLYPRKGAIQPGADADLVLFDPEANWVMSPKALHMNTDFSPYTRRNVRGRVRTVLLRGEVVVEKGDLLRKHAGRYLERKPLGDAES